MALVEALAGAELPTDPELLARSMASAEPVNEALGRVKWHLVGAFAAVPIERL